MHAAFSAAGYKPAADRLLAWAVEAWGKYPRYEGAGARRDYVRERLQGDPTWTLIEQYGSARVLSDAIAALLTRAQAAIEAQAPTKQNPAARSGEGASQPTMPRVGTPPREVAAGGGQCSVDTHNQRAPASSAVSAVSTAGEGATPAAAPKIAAPPRTLSAMADRQSAAMARKAATLVRLSRLDTVLIDGKPIGDCTVAEVRAWAERRRADARGAALDARFALSLVANLPSGEVIRQWWRDAAEVDKMYQRAAQDAENVA